MTLVQALLRPPPVSYTIGELCELPFATLEVRFAQLAGKQHKSSMECTWLGYTRNGHGFPLGSGGEDLQPNCKETTGLSKDTRNPEYPGRTQVASGLGSRCYDHDSGEPSLSLCTGNCWFSCLDDDGVRAPANTPERSRLSWCRRVLAPMHMS